MTDRIAISPSAAAHVGSDRQLLVLLGALYFTQGLPLGLAMEAIPVLLRQQGVPLDVIAFVSLAGLPWILKLLWAPLVDNHWLARIGRRRTWILGMQAVLAFSLAATAFAPLTDNVWLAIGLLMVGAMASATQDTATDGLAAERLKGQALSNANALQVGGMMAGFMAGGAGTLLMLDPLGQRTALLILAAIPALTVLIAYFWREPGSVMPPHPQDRARIRTFFKRQGAWGLLLLAFIYGGSHAGGTSICKLLLVDLGWSNSATGAIAAFGGAVMVLIGCPLGSWLAAKGLWRALAIGMAMAALCFGFWAALATGRIEPTVMAASFGTAVLSIASGLIAVSAATMIMAFAGAGKQAGTDVTALQSANVLGEMVIAGLVVWLAGAVGFGMAFALTGVTVLSIAGLLAVIQRRPLPIQ